MSGVRKCLILFVILTCTVKLHQCGRTGGRGSGSRGGGGGGYRSHPAPSPSRNIGWNPPASRPSPHYAPTSRPSPHYAPTSRPAARPQPRPTPSHNYEPPASRITQRPVNQGPTPPPYHQASTRRTQPQYNSPTPRRTQPQYNSPTPRRSTPPPYRPPTTRRWTSQSTPRSSGGWDLPPRPGAGPQGPPRTGGYQAGYQGPSKIKIVNKYNYHYPGYYSLPVQHSSYPGYYNTPSYYHYGSHDTGSTALGFYLGYSLAKLSTPTYSHQSFYEGYRPRYDHYEVHHYYHNRESVPQNQEIRSNDIVGCVGDSSTVCPVNTISLCTSTGNLMCVVSATSTVPCTDNKQLNCVRSTISCANNTAPECKNSKDNSTVINIPCVSNAKIYGELKYVDNTIIVEKNNTNVTTSANNATNVTTAANNATNITTSATNTTINTNVTSAPEFSTKYPITTTPTPETSSITSIRKKRDVPQNFCVTVLAIPAKKQVTEGELFFSDAKDIVSKFIEKAWNL